VVEWKNTQPNLLFETSCGFSRCRFRQPPLHWAVCSQWPAENGGILANGERELSISGLTNTVGDSGEGERQFRREAERHSGMIPNTVGA
jgi:hypothetical protein